MTLAHRFGKQRFFFFVAVMGFVLNVPVFAQAPPPPPPPPPQSALPVQHLSLKGIQPIHENAATAVFRAFDEYEVVALDAAHGNQDLDEFLLDLLRSPIFPGKINDIVVECGNSLYQPVLDRYIAGDDISMSEVQRVWRNTSQPMCGVSAFYEQFFPLVRRLNQRLPARKRVRVLAGDPPIDWDQIRTREDLLRSPQDRDGNIAAVMETEVLAKHRKALMLFGTAHLYHGASPDGDLSAVAQYEKHYPKRTMVVVDHSGFGNDEYNKEFEARMNSWPVPSLVLKPNGTWLGDLLDKTYSTGEVSIRTRLGKDGKPESYAEPLSMVTKFHSMADAYLYVGPRNLLLNEPTPAEGLLDKAYMAEMHRRATLIGEGPITDQADPNKVSEAGYSPFLYADEPRPLK